MMKKSIFVVFVVVFVCFSEFRLSAEESDMKLLIQEIKSLREDLTKLANSRVEDSRKLVPPGTIVAFGGVDAPEGWLLCDGAVIPEGEQYDLLRRALDPKGATKVPNLQGYFLRGLDPTGGIDLDGRGRVLGSRQGDDFKRHDHGSKTGESGQHSHVTQWAHPIHRPRPGSFNRDSDNTGRNPDGGNPTSEVGPHTHTITAEGGKETRPKNVAVNWIIKY